MTDSLLILRDQNDARTLVWSGADAQNVPLMFWGIEFAGEAGELCNKIKKIERAKLGWKGSTTTLEETMHEIGDVLICLDHIASNLGVSLYECAKLAFNTKSEEMGFPHLLP